LRRLTAQQRRRFRRDLWRWRNGAKKNNKKIRPGFDENILGGTRRLLGAPMTLVATVAESGCLDRLCFSAISTLSNIASVVTSATDRLTGLVALRYPFDPSTPRALLVSGRILIASPLIAARTDRLTGLVTRLHWFDPSTPRALLVSGRILIASPLIAINANRLTGLTVYSDSLFQSTRAAHTLHHLIPPSSDFSI
jgi:hypothetical protein